MQVHQVIHHPTLQIILNAIDDNLFANVHDLQIRNITLVCIDGLINLLIVPDSVSEISSRRLGIQTLIIRGCGLHLENVAHDEILVVAFRLYKQCFDSLSITTLLNPTSALFCRVCSIQNSDDSSLLEPVQHVCDGGFGGSAAHSLTLNIGGIEEIGCGLGSIISAVVSYVEDLRIDREPFEVALGCEAGVLVESLRINVLLGKGTRTFLRNEGLSTSW
jgi:hypothetical protein